MLRLSWTSAELADPAATLARWVDAFVARARSLVGEGEVVVEREAHEAHVAFHPAAGPIALHLEGARLVLEADTGTAGPGYHEAARDLALAASQDVGVAWPIGRTASETRASLEAQLDAWLAETATEISALASRGATAFSILLPEGVEHTHTGVVATPLGPRDRAWLERVKAEPRAGRDVFAWWDSGIGAGYFDGLARTLAWTEVRWRAPIDDRERAVMDRVVTAIERAHGLDPSRELPWGTAAEIYELLGESSLRATRAGVLAEARKRHASPSAPTAIGYRRNPVRVSLSGGWSLVVPGALAERWEDHGTWVGWDRTRTIWMSSLTAEGDASTESTLEGLPELPGDGELLRMERGPIVGHARFASGEDEGKPIVVMRAHAAAGRHVALGTIILSEEADREWALETWGTLDRDDL